MLDNPDLRVALHVLRADFPGDVFEPLERLTARMPAKPKTLDALVWDWTAQVADRSAVADHLPKHLGKRSPKCLIPHLSAMSASGRSGAADALAKDMSGDPDVRDALLGLIGDASEYVRTKALTALAKAQITAGEAPRVEALLSRKAPDLRRGVLSLLLAQPDVQARSSAQRLLAAKDPLPRVAGLEVLQQMVKRIARPPVPRRRRRLPRLGSEDDRGRGRRAGPTVGRGPRGADTGKRPGPLRSRPVQPPRTSHPAGAAEEVLIFAQKPEPLITPAARALVTGLHGLLAANSEQPVKIAGRDEMLLGNVQYGFPQTDYTKPVEEDWGRLPLADLWLQWWEGRPAEQRDPDGLELRARPRPILSPLVPGYYVAPGETARERATSRSRRCARPYSAMEVSLASDHHWSRPSCSGSCAVSRRTTPLTCFCAPPRRRVRSATSSAPPAGARRAASRAG